MARKIIFNSVNGLISAVIAVLAVVFIFVEGRLLFSGEWLIYDNVALGFVKYLFRLLLAMFALSHSVFTFINFKKKNNAIYQYLFVGNIALIIMSVFLIFTASNMVGEIALIISSVAFLIKLIQLIINLF